MANYEGVSETLCQGGVSKCAKTQNYQLITPLEKKDNFEKASLDSYHTKNKTSSGTIENEVQTEEPIPVNT